MSMTAKDLISLLSDVPLDTPVALVGDVIDEHLDDLLVLIPDEGAQLGEHGRLTGCIIAGGELRCRASDVGIEVSAS